MNTTNGFDRRDRAVAAMFFLIALAAYAPFRSRLAYHWDSAAFALAVQNYNVSIGLPHPPGFYWYVMLGKAVNTLLGDPQASLVWVSVVFGAGMVALMDLLGVAMFDRRTGVIAALFTLTSPLVWFHSCVALTYIVDAFWITLLVLCCWRAIQRAGTWTDAILIGALIAVVGGVRQQSVPMVLPVVLYSFWNFRERRFAKLALSGAVSVALSVAWFIPTIRLSGGWSLYWQSVRQFGAYHGLKTAAGGGLDALFWNVFFIGAFCWNGLTLGMLLVCGGLVGSAMRRNLPAGQRWGNGLKVSGGAVLAAWVLPMMFMGAFITYTVGPGHVFSFLPGCLLIAALVAARVPRLWARVGIVTAICTVNVLAFNTWPLGWDWGLFWTGHSAREIRQHDELMESTVRAIRTHYAPSQAVLCYAQGNLFLGLRHLQLLLPEFDHYELYRDPAMVAPSGKPLVSVQNGEVVFVDGIERSGRGIALLIVPPGLTLDIFTLYFDIGEAQEVAGSAGRVYAIPASRTHK